MDYWYQGWEDSIIFELQSSNKSYVFTGGVYHRFFLRLYAFTPFINDSPAHPYEPNSIRYLSKKYSSLLHRSLSILPNILTETPNMSKGFAMELLDVYRLCIDCLDIIAPELGNLCASLDHRYYYICCLRHWKKYDEGKSECKIVLEKFNTSMYETFGYEREVDKGNNCFDIVIDDNDHKEEIQETVSQGAHEEEVVLQEANSSLKDSMVHDSMNESSKNEVPEILGEIGGVSVLAVEKVPKSETSVIEVKNSEGMFGAFIEVELDKNNLDQVNNLVGNFSGNIGSNELVDKDSFTDLQPENLFDAERVFQAAVDHLSFQTGEVGKVSATDSVIELDDLFLQIGEVGKVSLNDSATEINESVNNMYGDNVIEKEDSTSKPHFIDFDGKNEDVNGRLEEEMMCLDKRRDELENELGLDREKLILMAMLLGRDYTEGVSRIGIVNAIEVVNAFLGKNGLQELREWIESPDPFILGSILMCPSEEVKISLLKFYFQEEVRKVGVSAMPKLFRSAKLAVEKEDLKGQIKGVAKAWGEMVVEFRRGCKDVVHQNILTEDSYLVKKTRGSIAEFLLEDRDPVHVWPVILFAFILALSVLNVNSNQVSSRVSTQPISAEHILLPDGRHLAYHEKGVSADKARLSIIFPHGFLPSRLIGIPGIKHSSLEEFGVRLISYDLLGFGESDAHPNKNLNSSALDMTHLADFVGVRGKFWVAGFSSGLLHAWAALKYIPDKVSGTTHVRQVVYGEKLLFVVQSEDNDELKILLLNLPVSYISQNWPVLHVAGSRDEMYLAIARLHGLILYDILLQRWRVFGVDAAIANAYHRILIVEIQTRAIKKVLIANSTSVIPDEVISHRLGLIPLKVDPRLFDHMLENDAPNKKNTIVFKLHARCEKGGPRIKVMSNELKWMPSGSSQFILKAANSTFDSISKTQTYTSFNSIQESLPEFSKNPIVPKHEDIIIAKLGPGQEIELEAHAVKGFGKTHAKWSPVATAWYRMLPEVVLLKEIEGEKAEELDKKCPVNVSDIEDLVKGRKRAIVAGPHSCTLCRECIRGDDWDKFVALWRVKDHFIFTIESTGANRNQAFIELAEINQTIAMITYYTSSSKPAQVRGKTIYLQYSNGPKIVNNKTKADIARNMLLVTYSVRIWDPGGGDVWRSGRCSHDNFLAFSCSLEDKAVLRRGVML